MIKFLQSMGLLRNMLHITAVLLMFILPFSHPPWHDTHLILGAVVPALAPIIVIIMLLDMMMCKIQQSDAEHIAIKKHYGNMIKTHFIFVITLSGFWVLALQAVLFQK